MNTQLLEEVKKLIQEEPLRIHMGDWLYPSTRTPCGTVGCIAGWTSMLVQRQKLGLTDNERWVIRAHAELNRRTDNHFYSIAREALEINAREADSLFYTTNWPREFIERYYAVNDPVETARVVCDRIDHFIATGE